MKVLAALKPKNAPQYRLTNNTTASQPFYSPLNQRPSSFFSFIFFNRLNSFNSRLFRNFGALFYFKQRCKVIEKNQYGKIFIEKFQCL